jgi:competence protein ComGC
MRNKVIASLTAGGVLIVAGFATAAIAAPSTASAQEATDKSQVAPRGFDLLGEALSDLVDEGVIDQAQADAVVEAVQDKADAFREERESAMALLRELLEDGVLTSAEADQLPDGHFLLTERFDEAWEDGQLTRDELGFGHAFRRGFHRGFHFGNGFRDRAQLSGGTDDTSL